mgnify:CR=1 FL=1
MGKKTFSSFLEKKKIDAHFTNSKLALAANISAVYLGEIIKKKKNPPDKKIQYALAEALGLTEKEKNEFFDLAAKERGELPVDIYDYLLESRELQEEIRAMKNDRKRGGLVYSGRNKTYKQINQGQKTHPSV